MALPHVPTNVIHNILVLSWPSRITRLAMAALFLYGGTVKLMAPKAFAATISAYDLIPELLLPAFAVGLPLMEVAAGLALAFGSCWGLHAVTVLLAIFVVVLGYAIAGDLNVDCGCFGADELNKRAALRAAFYRDLFLLGVVMPYLYLSRRARASVAIRA